MSGPDPRGQVMLAFDGFEVPDELAARLRAGPAAGVTLFRQRNVRSPEQVRTLTGVLRARARETLLVAADQEGGQFLALGDATTPFAGNLALGAVGDPDLAERVGRAMGLELRAMGVNVNYAPVCDAGTNPANPGLGIRSFGADPGAVASLAAAVVRGLQGAGVAATAKHFPGKGEVSLDTHHGLAAVDHDRARFDAVELVPFRAAIEAGVRLVMSGHFAAPALTGNAGLPATLARSVMHDLLRDGLRFEGLAISDALDMKALAQGPAQVVDVIAAVRAGVDLLLTTADLVARERVEDALCRAADRELLDPAALAATARRMADLRRWLGGFAQPDLAVVGCAEHRALARDLAERSVTLVSDEAGLLPLRLDAGARLLAVMPAPRDLTPADTSSAVVPGLARALRAHHPLVDEIVTGHPPTDADIAAVRGQATASDLVVVGTLSASFDPAQAALVEAVLATGTPTFTVALRTPFDLAVYPAAAGHACSYGILPPSLDALAAALFGRAPFRGRLPVAIPGLYPAGHGLAG